MKFWITEHQPLLQDNRDHQTTSKQCREKQTSPTREPFEAPPCASLPIFSVLSFSLIEFPKKKKKKKNILTTNIFTATHKELWKGYTNQRHSIQREGTDHRTWEWERNHLSEASTQAVGARRFLDMWISGRLSLLLVLDDPRRPSSSLYKRYGEYVNLFSFFSTNSLSSYLTLLIARGMLAEEHVAL